MNFLTILPARFLSFKFFLLFLAASLIATLTLTLPLAATAEAVEPAPTLQELTSAFLNGEVSTLEV